jgi:hypothetical protein
MAHRFFLLYLVGIPVTSAGLTVLNHQQWYHKMRGHRTHTEVRDSALIWPLTVPLLTWGLLSSTPNYFLEEMYYKKKKGL